MNEQQIQKIQELVDNLHFTKQWSKSHQLYKKINEQLRTRQGSKQLIVHWRNILLFHFQAERLINKRNFKEYLTFYENVDKMASELPEDIRFKYDVLLCHWEQRFLAATNKCLPILNAVNINNTISEKNITDALYLTIKSC